MRMKIDARGLKELDRELEAMGREVSTKIGAKALRASADMLQAAWQMAAPYNPDQSKASLTYGHARENIRVGRVRPRKETAIVFKVTTGDAFWMFFYEKGTVTQPARPWARPTVERMKQQFINVQVDVLRAGIEAQRKKAERAARRGKPVLNNGRNG
ncbi:MAG: hypothetical protein CMN72_14745 [Sphingomonas sp.]|nr:hypothetical protein [Sphingomonas sp.]